MSNVPTILENNLTPVEFADMYCALFHGFCQMIQKEYEHKPEELKYMKENVHLVLIQTLHGEQLDD